jgi:succinate dehydrogenase/fumarate reductase flavoprotein subunit
MDTESREADVVVVGGGMGGLVSANRALDYDRDVVVLEKGNRLGGSMRYAGGAIWTFETFEEIRELAPHGKGEIQQLVVDQLEDGLDWLEEKDVDLMEITIDIPGAGMQIEPAAYTDTMESNIESAGGEILLNTPMQSLVTDDTGAVVGVQARAASGDPFTIHAESTILATGGFQGNDRLVQEYITDSPENLWLRSNPWSTGDGLEAGLDIGAKSTIGMGSFYGHNLAAPPAEFQPTHFREASQYYGPLAIAVDENGERYADESISENEETLVQSTVEHADGHAYYVLDKSLYDDDFHAGAIATMVERAKEFGGEVVEAESLDALGDSVAAEWGVDGAQLVETVETFNEAIRNDEAESLDPPRQRFHRTFDTPPFYAVAVQSGITFTMGGLDVTTNCEVLRRSTSSSGLEFYPERVQDVKIDPIEGLYAAGTDVGNVHHHRYLGGLAVALVTGRIAGAQAAEHAE